MAFERVFVEYVQDAQDHVMTWGLTSSAMTQVCTLRVVGSATYAVIVNLDLTGFNKASLFLRNIWRGVQISTFCK